jgi:glycosyltransferase involved in cell wall biosynthesis
MISGLKLVVLANWQDEGDWSLSHLLKKRVRSVDVLQPVSFKHPIGSRLAYISNYLSEFYVPLVALIRRKRFDVIVSWQMRIGICYGILKRIVHPQKPPVHVIQDFHIDLTQHRGFYRFNLALLKLAIPGIDYFCCTSTEEEAIYSRMFNIPRSRIVFLPLSEASSNFNEPSQPKKEYIFSFGNSDRDFETLIRAVSDLGIKTYILSRRYQPDIPLPDNVSILQDRIPAKELVGWIASSRMVVLPLKDYRVSAGQISMLEVMALARPLVITENMATKEYAVHRHSALFFKSGSDKDLADHIKYLWSNRDSAEQIGQNARQAASKLNDKQMNVFVNLLERCANDTQKGESK